MKIFSDIFIKKINVQININVIELKWVEHNTPNTLPDYKTLAHVMASPSICMQGHEQSCSNKGHKSIETTN